MEFLYSQLHLHTHLCDGKNGRVKLPPLRTLWAKAIPFIQRCHMSMKYHEKQDKVEESDLGRRFQEQVSVALFDPLERGFLSESLASERESTAVPSIGNRQEAFRTMFRSISSSSSPVSNESPQKNRSAITLVDSVRASPKPTPPQQPPPARLPVAAVTVVTVPEAAPGGRASAGMV